MRSEPVTVNAAGSSLTQALHLWGTTTATLEDWILYSQGHSGQPHLRLFFQEGHPRNPTTPQIAEEEGGTGRCGLPAATLGLALVWRVPATLGWF